MMSWGAAVRPYCSIRNWLLPVLWPEGSSATRRKESTSCENWLLISGSLRKNKTELQNKQTPAPPPNNLESFRGPWVVLLGCVYSKIISEVYDLCSTGKLGTGSSGFLDTTLSAAFCGADSVVFLTQGWKQIQTWEGTSNKRSLLSAHSFLS